MNVPTISPDELGRCCRAGSDVVLIDVRTPAEFREVHLVHARNVPLDRFDATQIMRDHDGRRVFVVCKAGARGQKACEKLVAAGYTSVANVEGGTDACVHAGLEVVRGKKAMSLERQVRIAAGSLVLIGVTLGWLVNPAFFGLAAFVGAGLVFAGITDTCGMGMMLARMPWNQVRDSSSSCCTVKEKQS